MFVYCHLPTQIRTFFISQYEARLAHIFNPLETMHRLLYLKTQFVPQ